MTYSTLGDSLELNSRPEFYVNLVYVPFGQRKWIYIYASQNGRRRRRRCNHSECNKIKLENLTTISNARTIDKISGWHLPDTHNVCAQHKQIHMFVLHSCEIENIADADVDGNWRLEGGGCSLLLLAKSRNSFACNFSELGCFRPAKNSHETRVGFTLLRIGHGALHCIWIWNYFMCLRHFTSSDCIMQH